MHTVYREQYFNDVLKSNDILMTAQELQVHDLPKGPLGVCCVAEGVEALLERDSGARPLLDRLPHNPIGALPQPLRDLELPHHMTLNLLRSHLRDANISMKESIKWAIRLYTFK